MGSVPKAKSVLLIESVAEIREGLLGKYLGRFDSIAREQAKLYLEHNEGAFQV